MDGTEVFIHLINGVPLCREKEKERHRERNILGSVTCSRLSTFFSDSYSASHSMAVYISHMIISMPVCLPNHIGRLLALTSNETCDEPCHTGGSHTSVAGVGYVIFKSQRIQIIWFRFPDGWWWFQAYYLCNWVGATNTLTVKKETVQNVFPLSSTFSFTLSNPMLKPHC